MLKKLEQYKKYQASNSETVKIIEKSLHDKRHKLSELSEKEEEIHKVVMKSSPENGLDPQLEPMIAHYFLSVKEFRDEVDEVVASQLSSNSFSKRSDSSEVAQQIKSLESSVQNATISDSIKGLINSDLSSAKEHLEKGSKSKAIKSFRLAHEQFNSTLQYNLSLEETRDEYKQLATSLLKLTTTVDYRTNNQLVALVDRNKTHLKLTLKALKEESLSSAQENVSIAEILLTTIEKKAYEKK